MTDGDYIPGHIIAYSDRIREWKARQPVHRRDAGKCRQESPEQDMRAQHSTLR